MCLLFTFELLLNLHLGIARLVKKCTVRYFSLDCFVTVGSVKGRISSLKIRVQVLFGCNLLLKSVEADRELPGTRNHFSEVGVPDGSDVLFTRNVLRGTLKGKKYRALYIVLCLILCSSIEVHDMSKQLH